MTTALSSCPDVLALAEAIAQRCEDAHPYQDEWRARCPNHQGKSDTSLSITPQDDRVLVHCHASCTVKDIVHALGLTLADLFVRKPEQMNGHRRIVKEYDYYDVSGTLLFQAVRFDPKGFCQRRPDPAHPDVWIWDLKGVELYLYHLAEVIAAREAGETIYIVEGEKDADALQALGLTATCNPMGAGKWRGIYSKALTGCDVVILPDNDPPGHKHVQQVAVSLAGIARSVKVVPGIHTEASGSDVSDWLRQGGSREAMEAAVQACPSWTPKEAHQEDAPAGKQHVPHAVVVTMSEVEAEATQWLWWPYIALGTVCILDGDPGVGKTLLMTQLAASLSLGHPLPDQQGKPTLPTGEPADTLLLSVEDSLTRTLKPRLVAAGADCTKIHALTSWLDAEGHEQAFTFEHLEFLEEALQTYQPRLVVIDPVTAYMGKTDIHRANEVQVLMAKLTRLAERYNCAIVCIRHPAKPGQHIGKVIHRGLGSVGFIGTARTGLFAESHPTDPAKVLLGQGKSNMERLGRTQLFTKERGEFQWCGVSRITAEMMAGSGRGPDATSFLEALFWLEARLEGDRMWPASDLQEEAEAEGLSKKVLFLASKRLGVVKKQTTEGWTWRLPPLPLLSPTGETGSTEETGETGSTGESDAVTSDAPGTTPDSLYAPDTPDTPDYPDYPIVSPGEALPFCEGGGVLIESPMIPCASCGGSDRWDDHGTLRCGVCWPQE